MITQRVDCDLCDDSRAPSPSPRFQRHVEREASQPERGNQKNNIELLVNLLYSSADNHAIVNFMHYGHNVEQHEEECIIII